MRDLSITSKLTLVVLLCVIVVTSAFAGSAYAQKSEQSLRAEWLLTLTGYVKFKTSPPKVTVCTFDTDPFGTTFEPLLDSGNYNVEIVRLVKFRNINNCNIVYVPSESDLDVGIFLTRIADAGILTVSDSRNFLRKGGAVAFITEGSTASIVVNVDAAVKENIKIDPDLLSIAEIYEPSDSTS